MRFTLCRTAKVCFKMFTIHAVYHFRFATLTNFFSYQQILADTHTHTKKESAFQIRTICFNFNPPKNYIMSKLCVAHSSFIILPGVLKKNTKMKYSFLTLFFVTQPDKVKKKKKKNFWLFFCLYKAISFSKKKNVKKK